MPPDSPDPQSVVPRRFERRKTLLSAKVSTLDSIDDCLVQDLSAGGAEIRTLAAFQVNQKVTLAIPRLGPVQGRVVWSSDQLAGIQFMSPLDDQSLSVLAQPNQMPQEKPEPRPEAAPEAALEAAPEAAPEEPPDGKRAALECRLVELSRKLGDSDLEIAVEQIAVLSRRNQN